MASENGHEGPKLDVEVDGDTLLSWKKKDLMGWAERMKRDADIPQALSEVIKGWSLDGKPLEDDGVELDPKNVAHYEELPAGVYMAIQLQMITAVQGFFLKQASKFK